MLSTGKGVLQILATHHSSLFELLGKTSGRNVDKYTELANRGVPVKEYAGQHVLADCIGVISLRIVSLSSGEESNLEKGATAAAADNPSFYFPAGDHDVVICAVEEFETFNANIEPLYTGQLRKEGRM
jgi:flavin reductase (DIM6/NTAB) family NADH-FMN oxidoreductase RutF